MSFELLFVSRLLMQKSNQEARSISIKIFDMHAQNVVESLKIEEANMGDESIHSFKDDIT